MTIKITEERENALFKRKEIQGSIEAETTPSRVEVLKILSEKYKVPSENIKIKKIAGKFGSKRFNINANIYSSEQDKEEIELKKKKEKKQGKEPIEESLKKEPEKKPEEQGEKKSEAESPEKKPEKKEQEAEKPEEKTFENPPAEKNE